eukprot:scaffold2639_cov361-Pavlova_lutheri.AAC.63
MDAIHASWRRDATWTCARPDPTSPPLEPPPHPCATFWACESERVTCRLVVHSARAWPPSA